MPGTPLKELRDDTAANGEGAAGDDGAGDGALHGGATGGAACDPRDTAACAPETQFDIEAAETDDTRPLLHPLPHMTSPPAPRYGAVF